MPQTKQTKKTDDFENFDEQNEDREYIDIKEIRDNYKKQQQEGVGQEKSESQELAKDDSQKVKDDILNSLPKVEETQKPQEFEPKDEQEKEYQKEHDALPVKEEVPQEQVEQQEKEEMIERQQAKNEIEENKADVGTIATAANLQQAQSQKSDEQIAVEAILSEDLQDEFQAMTPEQQKVFKAKGEEAAGKIAKLLQGTKVQIGKILTLIKNWLKLIPGVNKYFLEQESKIRTDKLIKYKNDKEGMMQ